MSWARPEVRSFFARWGESGLWCALALLGLWIASLGGWILIPLGLIFAAACAGWALLALRRARFAPSADATGLIEITEGRLRYLHALHGGEISLADLAELRLITLRGRNIWQLSDRFGAKLLVPVDAAGGDQLFDALGAISGLSSQSLVLSLSRHNVKSDLPVPELRQSLVWSRQEHGPENVVNLRSSP